ncbi:MAG: hypothetical protein ACYTGV_10900 [Planctomycetota bacterium]|jgi:hypothetical protein
MRRLTPREHALLIAALLVVVAMGFGLFRVRPKGAAAGRVDQEAEIARTRLAGVNWPRPSGEPEPLERELSELRRQAAEYEAALKLQEARFVSLGGPGEMEELRLQISALADRCGVRIVENVICPRTKVRAYLGSRAGPTEAERPAAKLVRFLAMGEPYSLTTREVTLDAPYGGLRDFLTGLAELDKRIVVMRFRIEANANTRRGTPPLRASFLLVF